MVTKVGLRITTHIIITTVQTVGEPQATILTPTIIKEKVYIILTIMAIKRDF